MSKLSGLIQADSYICSGLKVYITTFHSFIARSLQFAVHMQSCIHMQIMSWYQAGRRSYH